MKKKIIIEEGTGEVLTPKFRTHYNFVPSKGESNDGISIVEPNKTLSIKDLLHKHTLGGLSALYQNGQFTEDMEFPDIRRMDLVDIDEYREHLNSEIEELKIRENELKEHKEKQEAAKRARQDSQQKYEDWLRSQKDDSPVEGDV